MQTQKSSSEEVEETVDSDKVSMTEEDPVDNLSELK
jgi:hypothetical protein